MKSFVVETCLLPVKPEDKRESPLALFPLAIADWIRFLNGTPVFYLTHTHTHTVMKAQSLW